MYVTEAKLLLFQIENYDFIWKQDCRLRQKKMMTWDFFNRYRELLNNFSQQNFENILNLILRGYMFMAEICEKICAEHFSGSYFLWVVSFLHFLFFDFSFCNNAEKIHV